MDLSPPVKPFPDVVMVAPSLSLARTLHLPGKAHLTFTSDIPSLGLGYSQSGHSCRKITDVNVFPFERLAATLPSI